jgi:1-phosphofructokinase
MPPNCPLLLDVKLLTLEETLRAAKDLTRSGVEVVAVSMGRTGAMVTDGTRSYKASPPDIRFVSAVGSGDAFVAAFLHSLMSGGSLEDAVRFGTAAGAANAATIGAGFCRRADIEELIGGVVVTPYCRKEVFKWEAWVSKKSL